LNMFQKKQVPILIALASLTAAALTAQGTASDSGSASFEVASIKVNHSGTTTPRWMGFQGAQFVVLNVSAKEFVLNAFTPTHAPYYYEFEVLGGPPWSQTERFDFVAKVDPQKDRPRLGMMMVNLLKERFKVEVHREQKEMPVFELALARSDGKLGPNIHEVESTPCNRDSPCGFYPRPGPGKATGRKVNMEQIGSIAGERLGRRVIDKTGLTALFDVDLEKLEIPGGGPADPDAISIVTAFQEQLGLKLRPARAQTKVLVIDHIERPTED
jgi:uncharacterized protein (TIGR03435 family)